MAGTRAKALAKMQAAYGYWRPLLSCSSLPTKVELLMVQTFIYSAVMYGAVWDTTKAVKTRCGGRESSPQHSSHHPETALF
jgi:hypothetical protein